MDQPPRKSRPEMQKMASLGSTATMSTWIDGSMGEEGKSTPSTLEQQQEKETLTQVRSIDRQDSDRFNRSTEGNSTRVYDDALIGKVFITCSYLLLVATFPLSIFLCLKVVQEYERAVVFRLGKLVGHGAKGPGLIFILPCIDDYSVIDLRTISFDVPRQEVLTKDSVTILVEAVVYYRIWLPTIAVSNVSDYGQATRLLTSAILRYILGTKTLAETLAHRDIVKHEIMIILDEITEMWGVKVERVDIKDVRLPTNFQRSMAVEAEAARHARAVMVSALGEKECSYANAEAADILSSAEFGMPLRFMQNLTNSNSDTKETTILFPIPMPMLTIPLSN